MVYFFTFYVNLYVTVFSETKEPMKKYCSGTEDKWK